MRLFVTLLACAGTVYFTNDFMYATFGDHGAIAANGLVGMAIGATVYKVTELFSSDRAS